MEVDNSDILGGPILQNNRGNQSSWFSASTITLTVLGLLGLYIAGVQVWTRVLIWKEKSYKLAMRRRHGIPDNDHRPFNVAYAAVVLARQEQEAAARKAMLQRPPPPPQSEPAPAVRQRQGVHREQSSAALLNVPGRFDFPPDAGYSTGTSRANGYAAKPFSDRLNFEDRYNPAPATHANGSVYSQSSGGRSRRASHKSIINGDSRKRAYTADEDVDPNDVKKSKYEHEERDVEEVVVPRRGYKRGASQEDEDDDEAYESKRGREKRLRKVSLEKSPQYDSEMEIYAEEDEDNVPEMTALVRGKKRDRAEAGSTFGGDEEDSSHEAEVDDQKSHRHRKRRNRRKSEGVPSRGTKRDRDAEEEASDIDSDEAQVKASRKKRGKKLSPKVEAEDVSMDDSPTPSVASGRVKRRIGEEWESNGVKFKIGPNGQRLRQTLVKKERQKFPMPMDSQHPDRQVNLEVCVETWLTEEEYREAKENHRLAWQDVSKSPSEPATPATIEIPPPSPRKGGKDLLWQSTATGLPTPQGSPPSTPARQNGFRQSMIGNGTTPITPFQPGHASSKRIASAPRHSFPSYGSPSLANSINGKPQLTRWEKEEMEANAIMKLRRKKDEEKKKLEEEQAKAEKEKKEREAAAAAAAVPKLPAITITKPEETKPAEAKPSTSLFGPPTTSTQPPKLSLFGPTPAATSSDAKTPGTSTAPTTAPSKPAESPFSFAPKPVEKPSASPLFPSLAGPSAPAAPPANQGSGLKFSFPTSTPAASAPKPEEKKDANQGSGLKFSFPTSAPAPGFTKPEEKAPAPASTQSSGSSLFARIDPAPSASTGNSAPFSFANPAAEAPKPASSFFNNTTSTATPATTTSATAEAPKFNFGLNKGPTAAPTSSSSLSGALGNEPKPTATPSPSFSFQKPDTPAQTTGPTTSGSAFGTPASSGTSTSPFNLAGGSSLFGNKTEQKAPEADKAPAAPATPAKSPFNFAPSTSTNGFAATSNSAATKPTFAFGATTSSGSNAFGSTSSTPSTNDASKSVFGGGFNMPSSNTSTSAAAPAKFSFGTPSAPSTTTEASKPFGSFGGPSTSATSQDTKPASTFGSTTTNGSAANGEAPKPLFGALGSNSSAPSPFSSNGVFGASTGAFGAAKSGEAAKTPAAFGFGAPTTGAQQPGLSFGTPSAAPTTNGSSNTFSFGDAAKSTTQPTTSLFGSSAAASPFGSFGAAAGGGAPFAFGKTPSTSGDSK